MNNARGLKYVGANTSVSGFWAKMTIVAEATIGNITFAGDFNANATELANVTLPATFELSAPIRTLDLTVGAALLAEE